MRITILLTLALLVPAVCLQAQYEPPNTGQTTDDMSSMSSIQGCLQDSGGHYTVTDNKGIVYPLSGDARELSKYVGHQVLLTGRPSVKTTDTTQTGTASSVREQPSFSVKGVKPISATCSAEHQ